MNKIKLLFSVFLFTIFCTNIDANTSINSKIEEFKNVKNTKDIKEVSIMNDDDFDLKEFANFAITGDPETKTSVSFSKTEKINGEVQTRTSYYKKIGDNWFHYKNEVYIKEYKETYIANFYQNNNKCSTSIKKYSCSSGNIKDINIYYKLKSNGTYDFKALIKFFDRKDEYYKSLHVYDSEKRVILSIVNTFDKNGNIIKMVFKSKTFYSNGKLKDYSYYTLSEKINKGYYKKYNKKGLITQYEKEKDFIIRYKETKSYHKNNKVKAKRVYKYNSSEKKTAGYYTLKRANGTKKISKRLYFKKGKKVKMTYIKYNNKGQKKSNKKSSAYKYVTKYKKNKPSYVLKAKYNSKGKLGIYKKVKLTKATKTF